MKPTPRETLETLLGHLGFFVTIEEEERGEHHILQIRTPFPEQLLGRRGEVLEALQLLLNRMLQSAEPDARRIVVDVEHHRSMQDDSFLRRMGQLADAVRTHGRPVETEPLNAYERRLLHDLLRDDAEIESRSQEIDAKLKRITIRRRG
jgi:spoIIIJ-associated protein